MDFEYEVTPGENYEVYEYNDTPDGNYDLPDYNDLDGRSGGFADTPVKSHRSNSNISGYTPGERVTQKSFIS